MSEPQDNDEGNAVWGFLYLVLMLAIVITTIMSFFGLAWWWPAMFVFGLIIAAYHGSIEDIKKAWEDAKNEKK